MQSHGCTRRGIARACAAWRMRPTASRSRLAPGGVPGPDCLKSGPDCLMCAELTALQADCLICARQLPLMDAPFPSRAGASGERVQPGVCARRPLARVWLLGPRRLPPCPSVQSCRANPAHIRQSGPDSGPGFRVKVLEIFQVILSSLGRGGGSAVQIRQP